MTPPAASSVSGCWVKGSPNKMPVTSATVAPPLATVISAIGIAVRTRSPGRLAVDPPWIGKDEQGNEHEQDHEEHRAGLVEPELRRQSHPQQPTQQDSHGHRPAELAGAGTHQFRHRGMCGPRT